MNLRLRRRAAVLLLSLLCFSFPALSADDPVATQTNFEKASKFFDQGDFDASIEYCQKALNTENRPLFQSRIYNLIGMAYLKQGISPSSAIGSFEQAIHFDPKFAEAYFNIASAYADNDQTSDKAVEYFKKAIEVDPNYFKAYFGLGWFILTKEQNPQQAIEYFQKTVDHYPDFAEAQYGLGLAYIQDQKPHMAIGAVSKLRELQRDDLAATLEKMISDFSPSPQTAAPPPASSTAAPAETTPASQPQAHAGGRSPFEVMLRGKMTRAKK